MRKVLLGTIVSLFLYGCSSNNFLRSFFSSPPHGVSLVEQKEAEQGKRNHPIF